MRSVSSALILLLLAPALPAAGPTPAQLRFFEAKVRPILADRCYSCHSEGAKKTKGGLAVDSLAALLQGGDSGPALVPGDPDKSGMIEAVRYAGDNQMPPKGKLPQAEIDVLADWVTMGAPWPPADGHAAKAGGKRAPGTITDEDRAWWAFQPVKPVTPPPAGDGWAKNPLDRFVAAKLAAARLAPAPEAEPRALIRRLALDLTGLPPTPEEVDAFCESAIRNPQSAIEELVDKLLASPRHGERQARLWLDLVRYADSDGYRVDDYRPNAWRYRDYVVKAFNSDKPFDRFMQEQLAGDELYPDDPDALVATGYLRHTVYEYNQRDARLQWSILLDDITDTTGDAFLGLGFQCAKCHDHKFDPILQKDYYRLRAFFAGLLPRDDLPAATAAEKAKHAEASRKWEEATAAIQAEIAGLEAPFRAKARDGAIFKLPPDLQALIRKPAAERTPEEHQVAELAFRQVQYEYDRIDKHIKAGNAKERILALRRQLAEFDHLKPAPLPVALAATDVGREAAPTVIPKRGTAVEPGFLTLLDPNPAAIPPPPAGVDSTGRRSALALWLSRPDHPLTARVLVNRLWQQHFGRGLAANASDFGRLGEAPTHPELLDWLAAEFVRSGWSQKHIHRLIVTSATYRQSAQPDAKSDPDNKWLGRWAVRRLDAEQVRDGIFSLSGELSPAAGGPGAGANEPRRAIYTRIMRNVRDQLLDVFDAPYWFNSASGRDVTTTPVQSLMLLNSPFLLGRAKAFAARLHTEAGADAGRVDRAYRLAFGRPATTEEIAEAEAFLAAQTKAVDPARAGSTAARVVPGKIPYRDGLAVDLRPGDRPGFVVPMGKPMPAGDFTIEAFVFPRSVSAEASVRTIAAKWAGDLKKPGWAFGISGAKSRRKPQTAVLQLVGRKRDGTVGEAALFSDQTIALNKPYYLAAAVTLATADGPGEVAFHLKDVSNDDEPLLTAKVAHDIVGGLENGVPMALGGRGAGTAAPFDGLLDDVRISEGALPVEELFYSHEGVGGKRTVAYWPFEAKPDILRDAGPRGLHLKGVAPAVAADARRQAWADFCQVLLNSSELLYVE